MNMNSNSKLKEIDIKNRTCDCFGGVIKFWDFNLDCILIDEKSLEDMLVYSITLQIAKPLRIRFDKIKWIIRVYDGNRCLVLSEKYD